MSWFHQSFPQTLGPLSRQELPFLFMFCRIARSEPRKALVALSRASRVISVASDEKNAGLEGGMTLQITRRGLLRGAGATLGAASFGGVGKSASLAVAGHQDRLRVRGRRPDRSGLARLRGALSAGGSDKP